MSGPHVHRDDMFDDDPAIAAFARDLRAAADAAPAPAAGPALAEVLAGRAPAPSYPGPVPDGRTPSRPGRRRALRAALGGAVAATVVSTLGVAGALPAPVQRQVARVADVIGLDLPGDDPAPAMVDPAPSGPPASPPATGRPPMSPVAPGEDPDRGHGNEDDGVDGDNPGRGLEEREDPGRSGRRGEVPADPGPSRDEGGPVAERRADAEHRADLERRPADRGEDEVEDDVDVIETGRP
ncbi:MAG TPA: hypothetical protein VM262_20935 [Acidimicrobiales bacterium]|nr:hypothetical protein [Acidimicrobiales bacterium]